MAGPGSKYHAARSSASAQLPAGRILRDGPMAPTGVRLAGGIALALILVGMLVGTIDAIVTLRDARGLDVDWGVFWAGQLQSYGFFGVAAALIVGASESAQVSSGLRIAMLLGGVYALLQVSMLGVFTGLDLFGFR